MKIKEIVIDEKKKRKKKKRKSGKDSVNPYWGKFSYVGHGLAGGVFSGGQADIAADAGGGE